MEEFTILNNFLPFQVVEVDKEKSIDEIAKLWKISKSQIIYINENLKKGDKVILKNLNVQIHIVKPMESLDDIAKKYNISKLFIGQQLII